MVEVCGGDGDWELLSVNVSTLETDTDFEPRLYVDTTSTAYFGVPFLQGGPRIYEYPFTIATMPDGPYEISTSLLDFDESSIASGRGRVQTRQALTRSRRILGSRTVKHHDENATSQVGVLDFSGSRRPPVDNLLLWLRGDGPLTVPTTVLSTDNIEVTETESLLLAKMVAVNLLERGMAGAALSTRRAYGSRTAELRQQIGTLSEGAGEARDAATYGVGW